MTSPSGGTRRLDFERILGITSDDIDYLEAAIRTAIIMAPVTATRDRAPYGINAVVEICVSGLRRKRDRLVRIRTVWRMAGPGYPPQLTTAFPRP